MRPVDIVEGWVLGNRGEPMRREQTNTGYNAGRRWTIRQEKNMGNMLQEAPASGEHKKRTGRKKSQSSSCSSCSRRKWTREEGRELRRTAAAAAAAADVPASPSGRLIIPQSADR
jgi:hypothetical protein